jgi:hypothetical protein
MPHPFELVPSRWRARALVPLLVAALALAAWLTYRNAALMNPAAPAGIWSLAAARDGYGARVIIDAWELLRPAPQPVESVEGVVQQYAASPVDEAIAIVQLRFVLILLYALAFSLACAWLARPSGMPLAGYSLSLAAWIAALLHAIENTAVLRMLLTRDPRDAEAVMASTCLAARAVLVALIFAWLARAWRRRRA